MTVQAEAFLDKTDDQPIVIGVGTYEDMQFASLTTDEALKVIDEIAYKIGEVEGNN